MNRKYIVICSFFVAFFVLSLLCYGSFEYAKKQEQKVFRVVTCIKGTEMKAAGIRDFSAVFPDEYTYRGIP